jgi:NTP pyrophosphatase (non-canonical NTP hydrolase)
MDELSEMYERQKRFLIEILGTDNFEHLHVELTEKYLLRLHGELTEVFDASKLKEMNPVLSIEEKEHQLEEMIDCFKYLLNLFIINKHEPEDIIKKFNEKSSIVEKRKK